jgi:flagellar basal-body rod protein FlgG
MNAQQHRLDAISNNLANIDTTAYKRDQSVHKAFPEILLRRLSDDGVRPLPLSGRAPHLGSVDTAPVVGRLGTGVEFNELFTVFEQGSLTESGNPFDLALTGEGFFVVDTPYGERLTRNGSFHLGPESILVTKEGFPVLGENGPIRVQENNFRVDEEGQVWINRVLADDPDRLVSMQENRWEQPEVLDRLRVVDVGRDRFLEKQGSSLYLTTRESGEARDMEAPARPRVEQGFLETANVNPVTEMVAMIEVNRAYEANQRVIQSQDQATGLLLSRAIRV